MRWGAAEEGVEVFEGAGREPKLLLFAFYHEGIVLFVHADPGIVFHCGGGGEQEEHATGTDLFFCEPDEFFADALFLVFFADGEVGEVAAVNEVGEGAGEADEFGAVPGGEDAVGVLVHFGDAPGVGGGTVDAGAVVDFYDVYGRGCDAGFVCDGHGFVFVISKIQCVWGWMGGQIENGG